MKSDKAFAYYAREWAAEFEALSRVEAERRHTAEVLAKCDADKRGAEVVPLEELMPRFQAAAAARRST